MKKFEERITEQFTNHGQKLFGVIHIPKTEKPPPVVVFCHGLAGQKVGMHRMYVLLAECLAKNGIASFRFDFRGSGDSEGNFSDMSLKGEVSDCLSAMKFIADHKSIDSNRIGVFGRSLGGAIAILSSYQFKKVKSVALWAPIYDAEQWEEKWEMVETNQLDEKERREMMRVNGQLPSMAFYEELFDLSLNKEIKALNNVPMLLIHGENDPIVSIKHSEKYLSQRKESKAPTEFLRLPHGDHDFTHPEEKLQAIGQTCKWFRKTLGEK